ncbi:gfo/Idh/MocA family oxidoreductase [Candidatus Bathyarchaeota archaeon]|nr:MAG: gfo/Idh/MocA family oxidoreductase [Candidatus Bathyarchaeota archaeon]
MIKIGFVGCGGISRTHVARLSLLEEGEAEIKGLCDTNIENAKRLAKVVNKFRNIAPEPLTDKSIYADYSEMLSKLDLDAIIVCTPHVLHYKHVMAGLKRGLHVLVEKPMAINISQAEEMRDTAEKESLLLAIGYQRHFQPEYFYAKKIIESGKIGSPHFVVAWLSQDLRRAIGSRGWYLNPELSGGGQVICSGTHLNDIVLWVTGTEPKRVKAFMDMEGAKVEMYASISVELSNGALASISLLGDSPEIAVREEMRVWCSKGAIIVRDGNVYVHEKGGNLTMISRENLPRPPSPNPDVNFVRALLGKEVCLVPASCGVNATKLEQMAYLDAKPISNNLKPYILR